MFGSLLQDQSKVLRLTIRQGNLMQKNSRVEKLVLKFSYLNQRCIQFSKISLIRCYNKENKILVLFSCYRYLSVLKENIKVFRNINLLLKGLPYCFPKEIVPEGSLFYLLSCWRRVALVRFGVAAHLIHGDISMISWKRYSID